MAGDTAVERLLPGGRVKPGHDERGWAAVMDNRLRIRRAISGDAALVLKFIRDLAVYEELLHEVRASEADIAAQLFGPTPKAFAEIAEWEGRPVGFALWFFNFSTFAGRPGIYLEDLFVDPGLRGKGIGKALLAHLARLALTEDCCMVQWWVLNWNKPSIAFYEGIGAKPKDEWTVYRLSGEAMEALARS